MSKSFHYFGLTLPSKSTLTASRKPLPYSPLPRQTPLSSFFNSVTAV